MVTPTAIYRFSLTKPDEEAFGLHMKVEKTADNTMMEWVLHEYISDFIRDYDLVARNELESKLFQESMEPEPIAPVNPVDWTSINLKTLTPLARVPNLGFLFSATGADVNNMKNSSRMEQIPTLQPSMPVIIKCLSAVLDIRYRESVSAIVDVLAKQARLEEKKKRLEERKKAEGEIARLRLLLRGTAGAPGQMPAEPVIPDSEPESEAVKDIEEVGIKHPYLGVGTANRHPLVVMRDVGTTLHDLVHGSGGDFCARWRDSPALRAAFLEDVGLTALNLVAKCELCHNDIRPPNIAFRDGRFCLLDFDMAHTSVQYQENTAFSPRMVAAVRWRNPPAELMAYSVAQIAVNVFVLDSAGGSGAGEAPAAASCIWSAERDGSAVDAAFERWVAAKGAGVRGFVSAVREACAPPRPGRALAFRPPTDHRGYFARVLRDMLA